MKEIKCTSQVDVNLTEGKLLVAAIAILTTENYTNKTPDEVIKVLNTLAEDIFKEESNKEVI